MHDIYYVERAPNTKPINICAAGDRIGMPYIPCNPSKIVAIIESDAVDEGIPDSPADPEYEKMSELLVDFLKKKEVKKAGCVIHSLLCRPESVQYQMLSFPGLTSLASYGLFRSNAGFSGGSD